jgi:uncharacterized membrane protein
MDHLSGWRKTLRSTGRGLALLSVLLLLVGWLFNTPAGLLGKADAVGYAVCHRIDLRSLHLGDRQLPLCVRCSGMYLGAMLSLTYQAFTRRRAAGFPSREIWAAYAFFILAFALDGGNSYLHLFPGFRGLYEPQNWLRLLTGSGMGLVIGGVLYPAFNQTVWKDWKAEPSVSGLPSLAILIFLTLLLDWALLSNNALVLYPLALVSATGVFVILTLVYTMVWVMLLRLENQALSAKNLWTPLIAGFGLALLQIAALDWLRFLFTGTWDGFHFG